jgi:23S rRNA pseudouridine1911/1915/1917 synthase
VTFVAGRGDSRLRLDQVVAVRVTHVTRMSRTLAQRWIDDGRVLVDGVPARRASSRVRTGAQITVTPPASVPLRQAPQAEAIALDVLYEDADLVAVNKPAGMVVHPSYRNPTGTLLNGLLWRFRTSPDDRLGLVSRLDKDTSGVLIVARSPGTHARLQREARLGRVTKEYLAVTTHVPSPREGVITLPLARDPLDRRRVVAAPDGAPSETWYHVVSTHGAGALVRCQLVTGRTHQIRVHLSSSGWPIVGDPVYGDPHPAITRQALHAFRLSLVHPHTGKPLVFEAPLPADIARLLGTMTT